MLNYRPPSIRSNNCQACCPFVPIAKKSGMMTVTGMMSPPISTITPRRTSRTACARVVTKNSIQNLSGSGQLGNWHNRQRSPKSDHAEAAQLAGIEPEFIHQHGVQLPVRAKANEVLLSENSSGRWEVRVAFKLGLNLAGVSG